MTVSNLTILILFLICVVVNGEILFKESFEQHNFEDQWIQSQHKDDYGPFIWTAGKWYGDEEKDKGIQTSEDSRFYALSAQMTNIIDNKDKTLVIQFSVKHEQEIDCAGGYIKLLPKPKNLESFHGETLYYIMFGPDVCGSTKKIHLIFNYKGKNLLWKKETKPKTDRLTHVYTAIVNPNNTYKVLVDFETVEQGRLEEDWNFLEPKEIPDPGDKKPSDWVDEKEILDPNDTKPDDWDNELAKIKDPDAIKPENWNDEDDGIWESPEIDNPKFKGEWKQKKIPNPVYKGKWKARLTPNPAYQEDTELYRYRDIAVVGFDLWQVKAGTLFDNVLIGDDYEEIKQIQQNLFDKEKEKEMFDKENESNKTMEDNKENDDEESIEQNDKDNDNGNDHFDDNESHKKDNNQEMEELLNKLKNDDKHEENERDEL